MLLRARIVVPISRPPIADGAVKISGQRIVAVGAWKSFSAAERRHATDLGETVLLPGLVNAHCHLDYTGMAGEFLPPRHFTDWLKLIVAAKGSHSDADFAAGWRAGAQMLLRTGTTTVADIEALPKLLPAAWQATPLRIISFLEMTGVKNRRPPRVILQEAVEKIQSLPENSRHRAGLSPHAPCSTTPELLRLTAQLTRHRRRVTTHVAESPEEFEMFMHGRGKMFDWLRRNERDNSDCGLGSPVQHLARAGLLGKNFLAVHANCLAPGDAALLARSGASVVHCPRSHSFFAHPKFPYAALAAAGVNLCLGTDSLASVEKKRGQTPELNLFSEMRSFARKHPGVSAETILRMATVNGARALGLAGKTGELQPKAFADLIALPFTGKTAAVHDTILHHRSEVTASMIGGKWAIAPKV
ncbi:MAG: amidohydrolase family protein [Verrucomicrobia bacterium]|nr:amidohydrolase family protein [Verrucomicrobiota bacterium]